MATTAERIIDAGVYALQVAPHNATRTTRDMANGVTMSLGVMTPDLEALAPDIARAFNVRHARTGAIAKLSRSPDGFWQFLVTHTTPHREVT